MEVAMRRRTYASYSIGCAIVWIAIMIGVAIFKDASTLHTFSLVCGGWWIGWLSATIARSVYPPPTNQQQA
jgi:threonine/homoserine/homoserine lactone efflux protein